MSDKTQLNVSYGIMAPSIEKQLKKQGFTLTANRDKNSKSKCDFIQNMRDVVNYLRMADFLTDSESHKVNQRMQKYIVKHLKPIKQG